MAVSCNYLAKIRRAVRRNTSTDVDTELTDIIEECRLDLQQLGVLKTKEEDETDSLILGLSVFRKVEIWVIQRDADKNRRITCCSGMSSGGEKHTRRRLMNDVFLGQN